MKSTKKKKQQKKKTKKKTGRPFISFDERQKDMIGTLAGMGLTQEQIADVLDVSRTTFFRRLKEDPELKEVYEKGLSKVKAKILMSAYRLALKGDKTMLCFLMKTKYNYRETDHSIENVINITQQHNGNAIPIDKLNLPLEVRKQILEAMEKKEKEEGEENEK
jgi:predicted transcriptional regulator